MEDFTSSSSNTLNDNRPTSNNYIRDYLRTTFSVPLPYFSPCIDWNHSELRPGYDSDDGSGSDHHAYSKPFLVLDVIWNLGFVFVSIFMLLCTLQEKPTSPLRVWISGYALQCLLHVGFVYFEYHRRVHGSGSSEGHSHSSIVKRLESANTIASSFWWVFGFYWIVTGGQSLLQDSPCLYWLAVVFLALDVFFMIFCIGMACIICLALFCCIPIVAIAYAMTIREGASEDEIRLLPRYRFHQSCVPRISASTEFGSRKSTDEPTFQFQASECCICLTQYLEGAELCSLPLQPPFSLWMYQQMVADKCNLSAM